MFVHLLIDKIKAPRSPEVTILNNQHKSGRSATNQPDLRPTLTQSHRRERTRRIVFLTLLIGQTLVGRWGYITVDHSHPRSADLLRKVVF